MPLKKLARNGLTSLVVFLQVAAFPSLALAQEAAPESSATQSNSAPASPATEPRGASNTGPTSPTGADANTYTQNPDGTWSNGTYTWNPTTKQTSPNKPQDYSYNPETERWDTKDYVYSPETGKYVPNVKTKAAAPTGAAPQAAANAAGTGSNTAAISGTGPNSNNGIAGTTNTNGNFDLFFNGTISNTVNSDAQSGAALVQGNTLGGSALSGDATAIANLINMLQSSGLGSDDIASFISNIDGDVYGDLLIDPNQLPGNLGSNNSNVDVNISNNGAINNDINLNAQSGDATVDSNTKAGDATTGTARAMANVINMINSAISADRSFLGMININGNLNGDILLPQGVLDALISNTGTNSTNTLGGNSTTNATVNTTANQTINNNIDTNAASGNASASSNTSAGNATTGTATTSVNTLNVVGQNITGKNGILVFVNVLGKWVGMVVGPASGTASITDTGASSTNTIGPGNSTQNLSVNATENSLINNNISVNAESGDATVSNNTEAGNATSGNAEASVNLLNIIGSTVDVSDFFGVLFINVFGSWQGNFGADSANGGYSQSAAPGNESPAAPTGTTTAAIGGNGGETSTPAKVFGFIARSGNGTGQIAVNSQQSTTAAGETTESQQGAVLGTASSNDGGTANGQGAGATLGSSSAPNMNWWAIAGILGICATIIVLMREYLLALRAQKI